MIDGHKPNHTCLACGTRYWACDNCDKKISMTWRSVCCTEGHYKAYYAMWQYGQGQISKEEARIVLLEHRAQTWENSPAKALIREIIGDEDEPAQQQEEPEQAEPVQEHIAEQEVSDEEKAREKGGLLYGKKKKH